METVGTFEDTIYVNHLEMIEIWGTRQDSAVGVTVGRKGLSAFENSVTGAAGVVQKYCLVRQGA